MILIIHKMVFITLKNEFTQLTLALGRLNRKGIDFWPLYYFRHSYFYFIIKILRSLSTWKANGTILCSITSSTMPRCILYFNYILHAGIQTIKQRAFNWRSIPLWMHTKSINSALLLLYCKHDFSLITNIFFKSLNNYR